jgi:hypothetical protein
LTIESFKKRDIKDRAVLSLFCYYIRNSMAIATEEEEEKDSSLSLSHHPH